MKVIFLDIDGVLNNSKTWGNRPPHSMPFDKGCIEVFNALVDTAGANIVISSSWRNLYSFDELINILRSAGVKGDIIDKTPNIRYSGARRGDEILRWLDRASEEQGKKITQFVILDDETDMSYLIDHLVKCDNDIGITAENAGEAIAKLVTHK